METIQIKFQSNLKSKILELLDAFSSDEVKISSVESKEFFDPNFDENKKMLDEELKKIHNGTAIYYTLDELDVILEKTISKYEN